MRSLMLNVKCLIFNSKFKIQNSKLLRSGFSMVELIFVIIVIGILAKIGLNFMPDNRLLNDTNFLTLKIKEKQKQAIADDVNGFLKPWSIEDNRTCIKLDVNALEKEDSHSKKPHRFSSTINVDGNNTICFDNFGRPYQGERLLLDKKEINVTYKDNNKMISVMPISGYVIIEN